MTGTTARRARLLRLRTIEHRIAKAKLARADATLANLARIAGRIVALKDGLGAGVGGTCGIALKAMTEMSARLDAAQIGIAVPMTEAEARRAEFNALRITAQQKEDSAASLTCIYPVSALRPIAALSNAPQPESAMLADPIWRDRLSDAVLEVRLPMRSIFARPELPLGQLLSLKAGDVIPICLPSHIPITVAGRLFAQGTVGESSGRAAIKIEKIEQGTIRYE